MNTTNAMILTAIVVVIGRWVNDKPVNARIVVGCIIVALALTLIGSADQKLANQFGLLILLTAFFGYGPGILKKLGYTV